MARSMARSASSKFRVKDRLYDELRIPALNLELDVFDPRLADLDTLKAKFDDFLTVVLQK